MEMSPCAVQNIYSDGGIQENVFFSPRYDIIPFSFEGFLPLFPV